ncbi:hypothetical protein ACHAXS_004035 [Conticribra weissflogii]
MKIINFDDLKRFTGLGSGSKSTDKQPAPSKVGKVLVLDGTNVVGHRVVNRLVKGGYASNLRVGMRDATEKMQWEGVEETKFVWENEDSYAEALKGMKTVFVTIPSANKNWDKHFPAFLTACHDAKIKRIVKLSFFHAMQSRAENPKHYFGDPEYKYSHDDFHKVPLVHRHALCDGDLILKGLDCTILFPSHLMSNVLAYQGKTLDQENKFYGASKGKGVNYVSPNDVAEITYLAILHPKAYRREGVSLLGPSPINDSDVAKLLTSCLGTKITYEEKPLDFFDEDSAGLESIKASGLEEDEKFPKGDFKRIVGREPESFEAYLAARDCMSPLELKIFPQEVTSPVEENEENLQELTTEKQVEGNVEETAEHHVEGIPVKETEALKSEGEVETKIVDVSAATEEVHVASQ